MNWTIRFCIAIMLTSATGTILFAAWYWIGQLLEKMGYVNIMYWLLRLLLIFWFVPMAYLIMAMDDMKNTGRSFVFFNTDIIGYVSSGIVVIWLFVVLCSSTRYVREIRRTSRRFKDAFICELDVKKVFEDTCQRLSVKNGRVKVRQSYQTSTAVCVGTFRPTVIIPVMDYTTEELQVIFVHELTHYKHKDQWLKHLTFIASCMHCFNPAIYKLKRKVETWAEYACDADSVKVIGSIKRYFQVILDMAKADEDEKIPGVYSSLVEDESEIKDRLAHIQRSKDMKIKNKWKAILCVATMFVTSTTTVYGATTATESLYKTAYNATVEDVRELSQTVTDDGYIEYEVSGLESWVNETEGAVTAKDRSGTNYAFNWTVKKNDALRSSPFQASSGQTITVVATGIPSNITYRMGIVQPDGVRRYVSGSDAMVHKFALTQTGTYYVYVQNMSTTTALNVSGGYSVE